MKSVFFLCTKKRAKYAALYSHQLCENISNYWVFVGVYENFPSNAFQWNASCLCRAVYMRCEMASSSAKVNPAVLMLYGGHGRSMQRPFNRSGSVYSFFDFFSDLLQPIKFLIQRFNQHNNARMQKINVQVFDPRTTEKRVFL